MQNDTEPASGEPEASVDTQDEVARLEALLAARSIEARALSEELGRVRTILRDAVARPPIQGPSEGASDVDAARLRQERDAAVARAVLAEATRVEERFELDEARGRLAAMATGRGGGAHEAREAQLVGRERGLKARLAETLEQRDSAEARLTLVEDDLAQALRRAIALERELADAHERVDVAVAQATRSDQGVASHANVTEMRGELAGLRARSEEAEGAFESARLALARALAQAGDERRAAEERLARAKAALAEARAALRDVAASIHAVARPTSERAMEPTLVGVDAPASVRPPRGTY